MPTTVIGEVEHVTYESEETGFRVVRVGSVKGRGKVSVVGKFPAVGPGTKIRATGEFVVDARHGEQFRADALVPVEPDTIAGLERYLGSGLIPGVGPGFAKRIVQAFGLDALKVLDEEPARLKEISGLGKQRAEEIAARWGSQRAMSSIMLVLQTHGASPSLAARIIERYGERATSMVQQHPYRLALEVRGIGFKTADRIARSLGLRGDHPERAQAGVVHTLESAADQGHVACEREWALEQAAAMLEVDRSHVEVALDSLWASGRIVIENDRIFLARLHAAEQTLAESVRQLLDSAARPLPGVTASMARFEKQSGFELAPNQRLAIERAASDKFVVITGGPGVGKTTIVQAIVSTFKHAGLSVQLGAPTGRAAKRLAEATREPARTLHRLLEYDPRLRRFTRDEGKPLELDALIVDEASMIDVQLGAALLCATPAAARVVIVGDSDQLPSVGPGAVLRDLIESGAVPVVRLQEIFRQVGQSRIVSNAHAILRGEPPESADPEASGADFFVIERRDGADAARVIEQLVTTRIPKRFGLRPVDEIQVLTPMHRGPSGTIALNERLQKLLNPTGPSVERRGQHYRAGDKVMQTKNDYERDVFNGDVGRIESVDPASRTLTVRFDERAIRYDEAALDTLTLAYATSIHKSQGSEYPAVVIPLLTTHFVMLSRNLLYTAVTRAKQLCCLVADPRALGLALGETRREDRMTGLASRLTSGRSRVSP